MQRKIQVIPINTNPQIKMKKKSTCNINETINHINRETALKKIIILQNHGSHLCTPWHTHLPHPSNLPPNPTRPVVNCGLCELCLNIKIVVFALSASTWWKFKAETFSLCQSGSLWTSVFRVLPVLFFFFILASSISVPAEYCLCAQDFLNFLLFLQW